MLKLFYSFQNESNDIFRPQFQDSKTQVEKLPQITHFGVLTLQLMVTWDNW